MKLPQIRGIYKKNYSLAHLTWFKVGGAADILFKPEDEEDLIHFLKNNNNKIATHVIGAGSNIIIRDGGVEGVVIKLGRNFTEITITANNTIIVGAGCLNFNLARFAQNNFMTGFEFLVGIPGTVGGGVAMNAGSYGSEFKDIVKSVHAIDSLGNKKIIEAEDIGFSYRRNTLPEELIFTKVEFKINFGDRDEIKNKMQIITSTREITQPITERTGGSTFANPEGMMAWELIDSVSMRGKRIGGAVISEKHCNFMINECNATALDLEKLGELIKKEVFSNLGIQLKWEIKRIGKYEKI